MRCHVEALFTCDAAGKLVAVNESGGGPAPRFFLGRTADGSQCWFRNDLDESLIDDLAEVARSVDPRVPNEVEDHAATGFARLLEGFAPVEKTWAGPVYAFPVDIPEYAEAVLVTPANAEVLRPYFDDWLGDVELGLPFAAVLEGDQAVSLCCSVRMTSEAHEAGVETHPSFRGKGHAVRATAAWARIVRKAGAVPLYSTSWENVASQSVARKLGLVQFGADVHLT